MFNKQSEKMVKTCEELRKVKSRLSDLEYEYFETDREWNAVKKKRQFEAIGVWISVTALFCFLILLGLSYSFSWGFYGFATAVSWATGLYAMILISGGLFLFMLLRYLLHYSKREFWIMQAQNRGIENHWMKLAALTAQRQDMQSEMKVLRKQEVKLKIEIEKIKEEESNG